MWQDLGIQLESVSVSAEMKMGRKLVYEVWTQSQTDVAQGAVVLVETSDENGVLEGLRNWFWLLMLVLAKFRCFHSVSLAPRNEHRSLSSLSAAHFFDPWR